MSPLGKLIDGRQERDAVHIAIAPVVAAEKLYPGQHICFVTPGDTATVGAGGKLGIVDPFLPGPVFPGDRFLMILYPDTVTDLRHEWSHPAFLAQDAPLNFDDDDDSCSGC